MEPKQTLRRRFSPEEDQRLIELVEKHGKKWDLIVTEFNNDLTLRQIRERYTFHLDKSINKKPWTAEEDESLKALYHLYGGRWSAFTEFFDRRTDCSIKNRYSTLKNREKIAELKRLKKSENKGETTISTVQQSQIQECEVKKVHDVRPTPSLIDQLINFKPKGVISGGLRYSTQEKELPGKIVNEFLASSYFEEFPYDY